MIFARRPFCAVCAAIASLLSPAQAAPTDVVPRGAIAYDWFGSLAAAGLVPNHTLRDFFRGDRLYTRREMALLVVAIREREPDLTSARATALAALEREFGPELRHLDGGRAVRQNPTAARSGLLTGAYKLRAQTDPAAASHILRLSGTVPVGRDGFAALSAGSYRSEWYEQARRAYPPVETAYVRVDTRFLDFTLGARPLRWGAGYVGGLMFSDAAKAVPMAQAEKSFLLPGRLGRRVGRLYFTQFAGQFFENDVPTAAPNARGTRRYLFGRRLETDTGGRWNLSAAESFKSTRLPDPLFALVLPFYLYQDDWTDKHGLFAPFVTDKQGNTAWLNYTASAGLSYRADGRGTTLFGDLLIDDVESPFGIGLGNDVPRKIGYQIGVHVPDLGGSGRYGARLEYASLDATTYRNVSEPISWERDDRPLGFPTGANARLAYGRFDARLTPALHLALDGSVRRRASSAEPGPNAETVGLNATYSLRPDAFLGARIDGRREQMPGQRRRTRVRFEVNAAIGF